MCYDVQAYRLLSPQDVDPLAWLTDALIRIADLPQNQLNELLPWH